MIVQIHFLDFPDTCYIVRKLSNSYRHFPVHPDTLHIIWILCIASGHFPNQSGNSSANNELVAKTFCVCKNFRGSNATLLPRFFWLCGSDPRSPTSSEICSKLTCKKPIEKVWPWGWSSNHCLRHLVYWFNDTFCFIILSIISSSLCSSVTLSIAFPLCQTPLKRRSWGSFFWNSPLYYRCIVSEFFWSSQIRS